MKICPWRMPGRRKKSSLGHILSTETSLTDVGQNILQRLSTMLVESPFLRHCQKLIWFQVLMNHIREKLPDMKARLNTLMGQTQQELNAFGDATFLGEQHRVCSY